MPRLLICLCVAGSLLMSHGLAFGQNERVPASDPLQKELELLKKELELLKRENDVLKRENEVLKQEIAALKKGGGTSKATTSDPDSVTRVTVGDVEYTYEGLMRSGSTVTVTVLAKSKDGNQTAPGGRMTLVDEEGNKYTGMPSGGFGAASTLKEGVPVKLMWKFGATSPLGLKGPAAPSAKIKNFAGVMIERKIAGSEDDTIDFRNVPAEVQKSKNK
jgi:hypothetical protein